MICPHSFQRSFNQFLSCLALFIHEASWEESEAVLRSIINEQTHYEQQINAPRFSTPPEGFLLNKYEEVTTFLCSQSYSFVLDSFEEDLGVCVFRHIDLDWENTVRQREKHVGCVFLLSLNSYMPFIDRETHQHISAGPDLCSL